MPVDKHTGYTFAFGAEKIAFNQMEAEAIGFTDTDFKYFKVDNGLLLFTCTRLEAYFSDLDIEEIMPGFGDRFLKNNYFSKYSNDLKNACKSAEKFYSLIWKKNFAKISDNDLAETYQILYGHLIKLFDFLNSTGREAMLHIETRLADRLKDIYAGEYLKPFNLLTAPDEIDDIKQERMDWLKMIEKHGEEVDEERIYKHALKYCWMFPDELQREKAAIYFRARQSKEKITAVGAKAELARIILAHKKFTAEKTSIIQRIDKETLRLSTILSTATQARMLVKIFYGVNFVASGLIKEIAARLKEKPENIIYQYSQADVVNALLSKKSLSQDEIDNRKNAKLLLIKNGNLSLVYGPEALVKSREILGRDFNNLKNIHEIKGQTANKGRVTGKIKIIAMSDLESLTINDRAFKSGDILLTTMTQPNMIPIAKRAAGIITDQGGITCHAAIISRELNIPCIIGCKFAMKVLRDGDLVEVDADIGIVRILKHGKD